MRKKPFSALLIVSCISTFAISAPAQMGSENYSIPTSVLSGGGAPMSSGSYQTNATLGQPSPLAEGDQSPHSDNYTNYPGFWYTIEAEVISGGAGEVIESWAPASNTDPWGIACSSDDTVWVGNGWSANAIYEYQFNGTPTGNSWPYTWSPLYGPADSTFNWRTGMVWTVDVGLDDCIHEMDPAGGYTGNTICGPWSLSQHGVAYDPTTDTWFVGGWNEYTIYHIDSAGSLLDSANVGLSIAGLAYNPDTEHLFVIENASPNDIIHVLDAANNYTLVRQFHIGAPFSNSGGAGLEIDCYGNLWAVDQQADVVYQITSGEETSVCAPVGVLEGSVFFRGVPCPPSLPPQGPPCDGPYPNYEITVYMADGVTVETQVTSDENGDYSIELYPGDYIIYTPSGPGREKTNMVTIVSEEITTLDLVIDTGIVADTGRRIQRGALF